MLFAAACVATVSLSHAQTIFTLEDVKGDDHGAGALIYPNRDDMQPGDLDLVRLSAEERSDGVWFIAEMAQSIRSPVGQVTEVGQTPMERLARNGFYTFNIDIYIDTDRVAGVGRTDTVPGRGVDIDRQFAWEKAIVLTPRPDIARTMLQMHFDAALEADLRAQQGKVSKAELEDIQNRSEARVKDLYFFPTRVRVLGRKIEFQVPTEFLGGVASPAWGYTAFVTGADLEQTGRIGLLKQSQPSMMTMTVGRGIRWSQFGIRSDVDEGIPPVVDLLAADAATQVAALGSYDTIGARLAAVPGMAPDGNVALAASGAPLSPAQASRIETAAAGGATPRRDTPPGPAASPTERRTVPARLRTLNELREEGLITEAEYHELRRKILTEL
jgi:hypothetical protein